MSADAVDTHRPAPPPLEFPYPPCSVCHESTSHDGDVLRCESCGIWWPSDGGDGEWDSDEELVPGIQCASTIAPYLYSKGDLKNIRHLRFRCALDHNHVDAPAPSPDRYGFATPDRRIHHSTDGQHDWVDDGPRTVIAHNGPEAREALDDDRDAEINRLDRERRDRWKRQCAELAASRDVETVPTGGVL